MAVALLPLSWYFLFRLAGGLVGSRRLAGALASLALAALVVVITETLSVFRAFGYVPLVFAWGLTCGALAVAAYARRRQSVPSREHTFDRSTAALLAAVAAVAVVLAVIALVAPPNAGDAMTYHLGRVVHWVQNRSVAHYPTHIERQVYLTPGGEFVFANIYVLGDGDRLLNLVQWLAMLGCAAGVSLIAAQLGAGTPGSVLAAVFCVTLPQGILEATTTQVDYVVALWLVCAASCLLEYRAARTMRAATGWAIAFGLGIGLALFSKNVAYLFALPLLGWFIWISVRRARRGAWRPLLLAALVAFAPNIGHYARNMNLYGAPLAPSRVTAEFTNATLGPAALVSNILRNTALHLPTPSASVNQRLLVEPILFIHRIIGIDANDRRTTWRRMQFELDRMSNHEHNAGNLLHVLLIIAAGAGIAIDAKVRRDSAVTPYTLCAALMFIAFCWALRWQPFHTRLHLPVLVLWSPAVALVAERLLRRPAVVALSALLLVASLPWVLYNETRPLISRRSIFLTPRIEQYFVISEHDLEPYRRAVATLTAMNCRQVGFTAVENAAEYPLWVMLQQAFDQSVRIQHVLVPHEPGRLSSRAPFAGFEPCAIFAVGPDPRDTLDTTWGAYRRLYSTGSVKKYTVTLYQRS